VSLDTCHRADRALLCRVRRNGTHPVATEMRDDALEGRVSAQGHCEVADWLGKLGLERHACAQNRTGRLVPISHSRKERVCCEVEPKKNSEIRHFSKYYQTKTNKLHGLSPRTNYTDRAPHLKRHCNFLFLIESYICSYWTMGFEDCRSIWWLRILSKTGPD
jgi:hypothetical protein